MIFNVIEQPDLIANRDEFMPSFAFIDGVTEENQMFNKLITSSYLVYATENGQAVGTYGYCKVEGNYPCMCPELLEHIGPDDVLAAPNNIYVRPEYRGSNLVADLQAVYTQDAIRRGFTHSVGYLPETEEIRSWAEAQTNLTIIRPTSANVDWITVRVLSS
jgi:hypothetical protein